MKPAKTKRHRHDYASAVRIARASIGIEQQELARLSGVNASYVSLIESGARLPSLSVLESIAAATELRLSQLVMLAESAVRELVQPAAPATKEERK
jgi:transcriptional regulator with XRE-family HTH domain